MGRKTGLTVAKIRDLEPKERRYTVTDGDGLGLEVHPSGLKSWRLRYRLRGRPGKINLGRWPLLSLADARRGRDRLMAGILAGQSPAEQRRAEKQAELRGLTVEAFGKRWITEQVSRTRKNPATISRYLARDVYPVIGKKPIDSVDKQELRSLLSAKLEAGHEQAALALRNLLKRMWDYAMECDAARSNPAAAIKAKFVAQVTSRSRALSEAELHAFLLALDAARVRSDLRAALLFILLTLTRKSELRLAHWSEFDLDRAEWALPEAHTKMETPLVIPLSRQAVGLLRAQRARHPGASVVFPMRGAIHTPMAASTLNRVLKRIALKIEHFTVHDLRRTAATTLAEQEFNADWIEKALNHKLKGVRGVYNRAQYATQRREMLQAWADWLDGVKLARKPARGAQQE